MGRKKKADDQAVVRVGDTLHLFGDRVRVRKIETHNGAKMLTVEKEVILPSRDLWEMPERFSDG